MTGYSARLNTAVTEAPDDYGDEEPLDARQHINKNKLSNKEKKAAKAAKKKEEAAAAKIAAAAVDPEGAAAGDKPKAKRKRRGRKKRSAGAGAGEEADVGAVQIGAARIAAHEHAMPGSIDDIVEEHDVADQGPAVGTLEWKKPIQADSHNGTRPSAVSNAYASVTRSDASYAEVTASLKSVHKRKKRAAAALREADVIDKHDLHGE